MGRFAALTYRIGPGIVRFSRRLYDALGLGHIFVGVAVSKARTCSPCVCLITRGVKESLLGYQYYADRGRRLGPKSDNAIALCVHEI